MSPKTQISYRIKDLEFAAKVFATSRDLGMSEADLLRRVAQSKFDEAAKEIIEEKRSEAKRLLDRYKDDGSTPSLLYRRGQRFATA